MPFDKWNRFERFPPHSAPRAAKGGIKASAQRGRFGGSWWGRRWIQVLESFDIASRLERGRSYARKGQVLSIKVGKGLAEASVQGSRSSPYRVTIGIRLLAEADWERLASKLSTQAIFAAKLLAGELPPEIEQVFTELGLSLFPQESEITTSCSCPDWSNPCKHVAAVCYLLGEEFDRDPFLIFRLRGMEREEFAAILGEGAQEELLPAETPAIPPSLPADPEEFWSAMGKVPDLFEDVTPPKAVAALPRRLGNLQFWRGELPLMRSLEPSYENAAKRGEQILLGEQVKKTAT